MGILLEILNSEQFRKLPAMYVGSSRFRDVSFWLRGAEYYYQKANPDQPPELDGFREWLHMNLNAPGNTDWTGMIESVFGSEEEATEKCFECLDNFLKDLREIGLNQIIANHAEYEKKRYGLLSSSRLRDSDETFYDSLKDKVESERCKKESCESNRIKYSVLCRDHHFEMIKKRPAPKAK